MSRRTPRAAIVAAGVISLCLSTLGFAGCSARADGPPTPDRMFPFVIPWDDARPDVATDVSFLNGPIERVVSRDGHFYGATSKRRIRFVGTAFVAWAAFPDHASAEKVAARLAKYGINLVRLHHMDSEFGGVTGNIWDPAYKDRQHISKTQLDRLDYLIAQLEKHGVYVDLNLHVGRTFTQADGFPPGIDQLKDFDTRVDYFDPRIITLEKNYAHDMLTHVNPYTKKAYAVDPGVAIVEITNEDSLVGAPWTTMGTGLDTLPEPFEGELAGLWNTWLKSHYNSDPARLAAWAKGAEPPGMALVGGGRAWEVEEHDTKATLTPIPGADSNAAPDAHIVVETSDGQDWHTQVKFSGLTLRNGETYTVRFRAKADQDWTIGVNVALDEANWHGVGLSSGAALGPDWKDFRYSFVAHDVVDGHCRLSLSVGAKAGTIDITGLELKPGLDPTVLSTGSVATANVSVPASDYHSDRQWSDWLNFLADTELAYVGTMRGYLKHDLGVHANVIGTQVGWAGMTSVGREQRMEFADNHAYWQHPGFPHRPWDPEDWTITNTSMVASIAGGKGSTLQDLAQYRVAGKPYTVSEYNEPAPSDFQAECVPLALSYAAAQDWDAIMFFDYGIYGPTAQNEVIQGFFDIDSNPAKMGFLPAGAMLFRGELQPPLTSTATAIVPVSGLQRSKFIKPTDVWPTQPDFFARRVAVQPVDRPNVKATVTTTGSGAGNIEIHRFGKDAVWVTSGTMSQVVVGFAGGHTLAVGPVTYAFDSFGNGFVSSMLTPMDARPIAESRSLLLTLTGRAENEEMGWNSTRTSVESKWGHAPVEVEAIPGTVTIRMNGPRKVYALDPSGQRMAEVPSTFEGGALTFKIGAADTMWYSIVK